MLDRMTGLFSHEQAVEVYLEAIMRLLEIDMEARTGSSQWLDREWDAYRQWRQNWETHGEED